MQPHPESMVTTASITLRTTSGSDGDRPYVEGVVTFDEREPVAFVGWLELMGILERVLLAGPERRTPQPLPD